MAEINLIPQEARRSEEFEKLKAKITFFSVAVLALTAVGAIVTLAFFGFFISQREKLIDRVEQASAVVNSYKASEELLVVTKDKATTADTLINSRLDYLGFFGTLVEIIPQRVFFTDVRVGEEGVTFSGKAGSSADIAGLVSALLSSEGAKIISGVTVDSLFSDESGEYTFAISAELAHVNR